MKAPQIIIIGLYAASLGISLADHGKPKVGKNNFWISFISAGMMLGLLWWGGFFG